MTRFILAHDDGWRLEDARQDVRGWPVRDRSGRELGHVRSLIADTDTELVESLVLEDGTEIPARDVDLGTRVVYVRDRTLGPPSTIPGVPPDPTTTTTPFGDVRLRRR